jgi:large subunit ribosomal protein L21
MRAVLKTGGKQYRVTAGDVIDIERLAGEVGTEVILTPVLMLQDETGLSVDQNVLKTVSVRGKIVGQDRAKKVVVFKKKRRKNYRRTQGHRQSFTRLKIVEIVKGA